MHRPRGTAASPSTPSGAVNGPAPSEGYARANRPLIKALNGHVEQLSRDMPRRAAAGWVFASVLAVWAEDHGLIPAALRAPMPGHPSPDARLVWSYAQFGAHPSTRCLLDPAYQPLTGRPDRRRLAALLDWWAEQAPDLSNPNPEHGPSSITGWLVGDLLQALGGDQVAGSAFCQTPWFVADLLCQLTVVPAYRDFADAEALRVIDPAAGTGHLLVWAALGLHAAYTGGAGGRARSSAAGSVRSLVEGIHGVELDPLTAAVARLRLTALYGTLLGGGRPMPLAAIPAWVRPQVAMGNALLAGQGDPCPPGTILDDTDQYPGILQRGSYHAVLANPPYKVIADKAVREAVRRAYPEVCHGKFPAYVPFMKLMFDLAVRGGDEVGGGRVATPQLAAGERGAR